MCSILNASGNSVCIMPTGSGKSLVFYMVSFLQPMPVLVIAPTDILISDQIRNLRETHNIDDVSHLRNSSDSDFKNFDVCTKFIYMTPSTFQNRDFLSKCIFLNSGTQLNGLREEKVTPDSKLAYIILDEIHCMSNWSHDFRPEYLMLSEHLKKYFTKTPIIGLTGTADYTVALDIQNNLIFLKRISSLHLHLTNSILTTNLYAAKHQKKCKKKFVVLLTGKFFQMRGLLFL